MMYGMISMECISQLDTTSNFKLLAIGTSAVLVGEIASGKGTASGIGVLG